MKRLVAMMTVAASLAAHAPVRAEPTTMPATTSTAPATRPTVKVTADRPDWNYRPGEPVRFTVAAPAGVTVTYTIGPEQMPAEKRMAVVPPTGTLELDGGTLREPGFLRCSATMDGGRRGTATAAFAPELIRPTQTEPADFDAFWDRAKAELAAVPADVRLTPLSDYTTDKVEAFQVNLQVVGTPPAKVSRFYGVLCVPRGDGPFPAMLSPPGAGVRGPGVGTTWAERGFITLSVGVHEIPVVPTDAFPRVEPPKEYPTSGLDDPEHYYFRRVILGCLRGVDLLAAHPKWDGRTLMAVGGSQGGYLSIATTALDSRVTHCVASFPAYCDVVGFVHGRAGGWPKLKFDDLDDPQRAAKIATTAYFDGVNFARRLRVPGHYGWGYNDETCPPTSTFSAYNVIAAPKELTIVKEMGHPRVPALTDAEQAWILQRIVRGG